VCGNVHGEKAVWHVCVLVCAYAADVSSFVVREIGIGLFLHNVRPPSRTAL